MGDIGSINIRDKRETILWVVIIMLIMVIIIVVACHSFGLAMGYPDGKCEGSNLICTIATIVVGIVGLTVVYWIDQCSRCVANC